jgi:hypothetical protein
MTRKIPVACFLTDRQLQARRRDYLDKIRPSLADFAELENGFSYRFPYREKILQDLAEIVDLERQCCPFLNFKLTVEAGNDLVTLELTGGEGAKEAIESLFSWN